MEQLPVVLITVLLALVIALSWQLKSKVASLSQVQQTARVHLAEADRLRNRLAGIVDLDAEQERLSAAAGLAQRQSIEFQAEMATKRQTLSAEYDTALTSYKLLKTEIALLEENLEDISFGVYKPHFAFSASEEYKAALEAVRNNARQMVRDGHAATCPVSWSVGNSEKEGARMVRLNTKLLLRAFNGECEAALANVSWNNMGKMEERVRKSFEAVNKLSDVLRVTITADSGACEYSFRSDVNTDSDAM